jgi:hypothetical protein
MGQATSFFTIALIHQASVDHFQHQIGLRGNFSTMRGDDHRSPFLGQAIQKFDNQAAGAGIQIAAGFIRNDSPLQAGWQPSEAAYTPKIQLIPNSH